METDTVDPIVITKRVLDKLQLHVEVLDVDDELAAEMWMAALAETERLAEELADVLREQFGELVFGVEVSF